MITKTITDPLKEEILNTGRVSVDSLHDEFASFPWDEFISKMKRAKDEDIFYSPSLGFQNTETNHKVEISYVDSEGGTPMYYLFFVRPKSVKKFFGMKTVDVPEFVSDKLDCSTEDCLSLLDLFSKDAYEELEQWFG